MIIRPSHLLCGLVAAAALAACAPAAPPVDNAKETAALRSTESDWVRDFKAHDMSGILGHYASDAASAAPGSPVSVGADAIKQSYASTFNDPAFSLVFAPDRIEVSRSGDMAYTVGRYDQVSTDPKTKAPTHEVGTYVTVYRKEPDGSWKAVADINTPGPGTKPPTAP